MLNAPVNPVSGHTFVPCRQICATWVFSAWERVAEALVRKAWSVGNYKTFEELQPFPSEESSEHHFIICNQNNIIEIITEEENSVYLIQHNLADDNVYADCEFDDDNVFE